MDDNDHMMKELESLCKQIIADKHNMTTSVNNLEGQKEMRMKHKKETMVKEMKEILARLNTNEEIVVNELKADAFSKLQEAAKIFEEANALQCAIRNQQKSKEHLQADIQGLQKSFQKLDIDFFSRSIALEVKTGPSEVSQMRENYCDAVFFGSNVLNPKRFIIEGESITSNTSFLEFSILCPDAEVMRHNLTLEKIKIIVTDPKAGVSLEQTTAMEKVARNQAALSFSQGISKLTVQVKRHSVNTLVSVKMFGTNITNSPVIVPATTSSNFIPLSLNHSLSASMLDATAILFAPGLSKDLEGLDSSELRSLDLTGREALLQQGYPKPLASSSRKVSVQPNMSTVAEESVHIGVSRPQLVDKLQAHLRTVQDPPGSASNSPFAPKSKTLASTMKGDMWGGDDSIVNVEDTQVEGNTFNTADTDKWEDVEEEDPAAECDQDPAETMWVQDDPDDEDPHLYLNASKAPSPTSANKSIDPDPCWNEDYVPPTKKPAEDLEESRLPDFTEMEGGDVDVTLWESVIQDVGKFNFIHGNLEVMDTMKPQTLNSSSRRGDNRTLRAPSSVAYVPQCNVLLVTEPTFNRIGIYTANSMKFVMWLFNPMNERRHFIAPTHILSYGDKLAIIENDEGLLLATVRAKAPHKHNKLKGPRFVGVDFHHYFKGSFFGLALRSAESGEIITIFKPKNKGYKVALIGGKRIHKTYGIKAHNFNIETAKMRFLTCFDDKVVITDLGNHRLIYVNIKTKQMKVTGYYGHNFGHFNRPTGVLFDDKENLLVCDSVNDRLVVFNKDLEMVKIMPVGAGAAYRYPQGITRVGKLVYVVYLGNNEDEACEAAVIKYKLKIDGVSADSTPNTSISEATSARAL